MINARPEAAPRERPFIFPGYITAAYIFLALFSLWVLVPFYVIVVTSITPFEELVSTMSFIWFPDRISFNGYRTILFEDINAINGVSSILRGFFNTLWMTVPTVVVGLLVSGLAAYAYSKLRFKCKNVLYMLTLATMMIPGATLTLPSFLYYNALGWADGPLPIMIPGMFGGAGTVFFLRQFFSGIPDDLIEAGKLDGMGYFKMYFGIMLPLAVPAFLAQGIFAFVGGYNNFLGPLLYLTNRPELQTLQYALSLSQGFFGNDNSVLCASAVLALLPILIVYAVCQKFFVQGVAAAGLKG